MYQWVQSTHRFYNWVILLAPKLSCLKLETGLLNTIVQHSNAGFIFSIRCGAWNRLEPVQLVLPESGDPFLHGHVKKSMAKRCNILEIINDLSLFSAFTVCYLRRVGRTRRRYYPTIEMSGTLLPSLYVHLKLIQERSSGFKQYFTLIEDNLSVID